MCQPYRVEETTCSRCGEDARFVNILNCKKTDSQLDDYCKWQPTLLPILYNTLCVYLLLQVVDVDICIAVFVFYLGRAAVTRSCTRTPRRPTEVICVRNAAQEIGASSRPPRPETLSPGIAKTRPTSFC